MSSVGALVERVLAGEDPDVVAQDQMTEALLPAALAALARFISPSKALTGFGILMTLLAIPLINRAARANLQVLRDEIKDMEKEAALKASQSGEKYESPKMMLNIEAQMHPSISDQVMIQVSRGSQILFRGGIPYTQLTSYLKSVKSASYVSDSEFVRGLRTLRKTSRVMDLSFITTSDQLLWFIDRVEAAI